MTWWQAIILGALQGVTEFLPVSSSGHLVLAQHFLGFNHGAEADGAAIFFDGSLHLGTLLAVLTYFFRDFQRAAKQLLTSQHSAISNQQSALNFQHSGGRWAVIYLIFLVGLASLPAAAATLSWSDHIKESFTDARSVAVNLCILGGILLISNQMASGQVGRSHMRGWQALLIGVAQAGSALFRGLSRSGMTVSMGLIVGLDRQWAVRFSFLMSIIASLGLGGMGIYKGIRDPNAAQWMTPQFITLTVVGTLISAIVGYLTIGPLIRIVRQCKLWWFSIYLWLIGATSLVLL